MSEIAPLISDLAVILIAAGIVTLIFKLLKQPVVLGYIVAGLIAGPAIPFVPTVSDPANIRIWGDIGVIFLLFAMGLDFSFKKLMHVGGTALVGAVTIVTGMMFLGYGAGLALGFSNMSSLFLGGMLSMSSTAIVYKAFDDMGLRRQKFAGVVLGILVVEDLFAVVLMVLLSTLAVSKEVEGGEMLASICKLGGFLIFWSLLGIYLIPTFLKRIRRLLNDETLLILVLGLCLGMVMIAARAGFSAALGAFVMGSLLAETFEAERIEKIIKPVKDLFSAIFFVSVGMMIQPETIAQNVLPILLLTILVIVGQVLFGSLGILISGQPLKIAMQSSFCLTQVGEFAFIIASLGMSLKVTDDKLYPIIVAVSVITTFLTPYMIRLSEPAYRYADQHLSASFKMWLNRYTSGSNTVKHKSLWTKLLKSMLFSVLLLVVLCLFLIVLFFTYVAPWVAEHLPGVKGSLVNLAIILSVIAPFLWAIIMKKNRTPEFRKLWNDSKYNRGPLVSLVLAKILLCVAILMFVIARLLNIAYGAGLGISLLIVTAMILSKRIRKRYLSIEHRFLENFGGQSQAAINDEMIREMPFGNLHLADFTLAPDTPLAGKTLAQIEFRQRFGINIVSIIRGNRRINIPGRDEMLFPQDKIVVVGSDDDLERFLDKMDRMNQQTPQAQTQPSDHEVSIEQFSIDPGSPLVGRSIGEARIRDRGACLILGIERAGQPLMNPSADVVFEENDIVWIVGERKQILHVSEGHID